MYDTGVTKPWALQVRESLACLLRDIDHPYFHMQLHHISVSKTTLRHSCPASVLGEG